MSTAVADAPAAAPTPAPASPGAVPGAPVLDAMFGKPGAPAPAAAAPAPAPAPAPAAPAPASQAPAAPPAAPAPAAAAAAPKPGESAPEPRSLLAGDPKPGEKPADAPKPGDAAAKPGDKPADAPAAPTYKLALPEKSALSATDLAEIQTAATELGLNEKQATALLAREDKRAVAARDAVSASQKAEYAGLFNSLADQMKADKDFGGEHLKATLQNAQRALRTYFDAPFVDALMKTPFGSHPGLLRGLARAGLSLREDAPPSHSTPGGTSVAELPPHVRAFPEHYPQLIKP
jgi:hypothetical protein